MEFPPVDIHGVFVGLMVFLRVSLIIVLLPVLGHAMVPAPVKVGLAALLSLTLYPIVAELPVPLPASMLELALIAAKEMVIAAALAFLAQLVFAVAQFAGQSISYQMGLAIANVFDPYTSAQIAVVGQFAVVVAMLVWLGIGAHHAFLLALSDSFRLLPIGASWSFHGWQAINDAAAAMFATGLRLMAPVMLLVLFLYVGLGLVARAVPQIQVFFVSFPLTVGLGLLTFSLTLPAFAALLRDDFAGLFDNLPAFLAVLEGK